MRSTLWPYARHNRKTTKGEPKATHSLADELATVAVDANNLVGGGCNIFRGYAKFGHRRVEGVTLAHGGRRVIEQLVRESAGDHVPTGQVGRQRDLQSSSADFNVGTSKRGKMQFSAPCSGGQGWPGHVAREQ